MTDAPSGTIPHSSGTAPPRWPVPALACDAHCHILDARFAMPGNAPAADMGMAGYHRLQARIGTTRAVIVQAKYHGTDNSCLLDAIAQLGGNGRGIAVVHPDVSDAELKRLHARGVRGLRFSVWNPTDTVATIAMIAPLAERIAPLRWHAQLHMSGDQIVEHAALIARLPCRVVIDHMGRLPPAQGAAHPAFKVMREMLEAGQTWVKLSGAYLNSRVGPPDYPDATKIARALVALAPSRLVWGSDWPHVTEPVKPDDANLLDLLSLWSGDPATQNRILVDNAAELYGFAC
jgi:D-galactarolactone isomerase